jgi:hypothetical protein
VSVTIQLRRGTAAEWTSANPVLADGEFGIEKDTGKFKFGNGTTAWTSLAYWVGGAAWNGGTASGYFAGAVESLTDASTISVNAAQGNYVRVALTTAVGSSRMIAAPTNPVDGQEITFELIQPASGGPLTVTWASGTGGYSFGSAAAPTLSTTASASSLVAFQYSGAKQMWLYAADPPGAAAAAQAAAQAASVPLSGGAMSGHLAPKSVSLTDAATIVVDASQGNDFYVTLGGNRTIAAPLNPADGQSILFELIQDSTGSRTVTWTSGAGGYAFGSGSAPVLSTSAGATDQVGFRYSARKAEWLSLGGSGGF